MAKVLKQSKFIVRDECTMAHKKIFGSIRPHVARFTKDQIPGDFRQTLPIIPRSAPADELNAYFKSSDLWKDVKMLKLNMIMRAELQND